MSHVYGARIKSGLGSKNAVVNLSYANAKMLELRMIEMCLYCGNRYAWTKIRSENGRLLSAPHNALASVSLYSRAKSGWTRAMSLAK